MFGFNKMFDFNHDGRLDSFERASEFMFINDIMQDESEEADVFGEAGLDPVEFDF